MAENTHPTQGPNTPNTSQQPPAATRPTTSPQGNQSACDSPKCPHPEPNSPEQQAHVRSLVKKFPQFLVDLCVRTAPIVAIGYRFRSMVVLIICCLMAFGIFALKEMNKNEFPPYTMREGLFVAAYPGATSEQLEQEVMKPMEDFVFSFQEVKKTKTHSDANSGMVYIYVSLNDEIDDTEPFWNKFKIGASNLRTELPPGVLGTVVMSDFGSSSALLITMSSKYKTYRELGKYMDHLRDRLRGIESVGKMSIFGRHNEQISVYVDNERLSHYGIGQKELATVLAAQGFSTTSGSLKTPDYTAPITLERPVGSVADVADQVVLTLPGTGTVVRVKDVARVVKEYPERTSFVTNNHETSIGLSIEIKPGHNVVVMGDKVEAQIEEFQKTLPSDVNLFRITNQPYDVNNSVINFLTELIIAVIAVVVAIMLLLPWKAALISAATIPITIFISLGLFYAFGIELNTVTLACLIVSLGMIVDNSVIIIDNYEDLIAGGVDHYTATMSSATQFFQAILSATLAISITFFPFLITMTGMMHNFLTDFPWGISIILFISLIVAEMVVPFLQYKFIKKAPSDNAAQQWRKHFTFLGFLQWSYDKLADLCFRWPKTTLVVGLASIVFGGFALVKHPMKLMPVAERNQFAVEIYLPTGTPLAHTSEVADSLADILHRDDRVVSVAIFHGCSSPRFQTTYAPQVGGPNYAQFIVNTKSNSATVDVLNEYTAKYENYFPNAVIKFKQLSYSQAANPIELHVMGDDYETLQGVSDSILSIMRSINGLTIVRSSLDMPQMAAQILPDDAAMSRLGISSAGLQLTMAMRYSSGLPVASVWEGDYDIPVVVRTDRGDTATVSQVRNEQIPLLVSGSVPLSQFAKVAPKWTRGNLSHRAGMPTVTLMASNERGVNALTLTRQLEGKLKDFHLPEGVKLQWGGEIDQVDTIVPELGAALAMAAVIIFFILLFHYKQVRVSFLLVVCLICVIPGTAAGLAISGVDLSLTCTLGIISLMGILVRNVIVLLDYAEALQRREGLSPWEATLAASKRRMRPIFLTSSACSMGVIPMMISDSGLWQPMGAVIFWGTLITMVYILTFIPVAYAITSHKPHQPTTPQPATPLEPADPLLSNPTPVVTTMKKAPAVVALAALLLLPLGLKAQNVSDTANVGVGVGVPLTLTQCRQMALQNNSAIHTADNRRQAAREVRREAFTKYFPEISATGMAFAANKGILAVGILDLLEVNLLSSAYGGGVTFVQPIFMGGQIVNGNKLAEVGEAVAELQSRQSREQVVMTTDRYFWQIEALKAKRSTLMAAMHTVDSLRANVQAALDAGVVTLNDLLEVKLKLAQLQADSIDLDNGIALYGMIMGQYIGAGTEGVQTVGERPSVVEAPPFDVYRDPEQALLETNDYRLLCANVEASELRRRMEVGKRLPAVAGGGGVFYQSMLDAKHSYGALFVSVNIPLSGWWGGSHAIKKARLETENARLQLDNDSELLQIKMRNAWDDLTAAQRKTSIAADAIGQAQENLRIYRAMYDAGTTTITDLLNAQTLHRQACDALTEAYAQYRVALSAYLLATAQLASN